MTTKSGARFAVNVDGVPRSVLSIAVRKSGDLVLTPKSAESFREFGLRLAHRGETEHHNSRIISQKFSVHPSRESVTGVNVITHNLVRASGTVKTRQHTKAIKTRRGFAYLYSRRCPDLTPKHYEPRRRSGVNYEIGSYAPAEFTLMMAVAVGYAETPFNVIHPGTVNYRRCKLGEFSVVLMWCYNYIPSDDTGFYFGNETLPPEVFGEGCSTS
jgi:hypothetical protein